MCACARAHTHRMMAQTSGWDHRSSLDLLRHIQVKPESSYLLVLLLKCTVVYQVSFLAYQAQLIHHVACSGMTYVVFNAIYAIDTSFEGHRSWSFKCFRIPFLVKTQFSSIAVKMAVALIVQAHEWLVFRRFPWQNMLYAKVRASDARALRFGGFWRPEILQT